MREMMKESEEVEHVSLLAFQPECGFPTERWGKMSKAVRVVAWVRRFIENCRCRQEKRILSELTSTELANARNELLRQEQRRVFHDEWTVLKRGKKVSKSSAIFRLAPFLDDDGLLRVGSRLEMSELQYEEKYPVLVPRGHLAELLVREQHFLLCHAGVNTMVATLRAAYFILGLRCTAKRVKRACVSCQRFDSQPCNQEAAPLPGCRVSEAPPFTVTGVDFAGPIFSVDFPRKKFYVCLFTCAVTRAVHLEMTEALSLEEFMMALRRFSARRGVPRIIYSDNAPTFKGADTQLQRLFGHLAPEWRFNVPHSPWWGGFFERLIKSIKLGLRKSLGTRCLKRTELETMLFEVECCVNSRPLTFVGEGLDAPPPLTPSHFLTGRGAGFPARISEDPDSVNSRALSDRARVCERRLTRFWSVWSSEYLRSLPPSVRKFRSQGQLSVGSLVLLREDKVPRMKWVRGIVTKLHMGRDGRVRSAEVRTASGLKTRPVQRLHDLEVQ